MFTSNYRTVVHWLWNNWARTSERCCIGFVCLVWSSVCRANELLPCHDELARSQWPSARLLFQSLRRVHENDSATHFVIAHGHLDRFVFSLFSILTEARWWWQWGKSDLQLKFYLCTCWEIAFINARLNQILIKPEERRLIDGIVCSKDKTVDTSVKRSQMFRTIHMYTQQETCFSNDYQLGGDTLASSKCQSSHILRTNDRRVRDRNEQRKD